MYDNQSFGMIDEKLGGTLGELKNTLQQIKGCILAATDDVRMKAFRKEIGTKMLKNINDKEWLRGFATSLVE